MRTDKEKELDNLFKSGLEQPGLDTNFREADWDAMEDLLGNEKRHKGIVFWLPILSGVAALLILTLGWFFIGNNKQVSDVSKYVHTTVKKQNRALPNDSSAKADATVKTQINVAQNNYAPAQEISTSNIRIAAQKTTDNKTKANKLATNNTIAVGKTMIKQNRFLSQNNASNNLVSNQYNRSHNPEIEKMDADYLHATTNGDHALLLSGFVPELSVVDSISANPTIAALPVLNKPIVDADNNSKRIIKPVGNAFKPSLSITVLASPDLNGTNTLKSGVVGTNIGLMFAVAINKKLNISTGALYSVKPYTTDFNNYHTNYQFKTNPENVSANCKVLDIPINLDYLLHQKDKNKFSIGTGLSTYFMLRENYHYNYEYANTPGPTDYNISNRNKYVLGVLNLNATLQRQINSKFSLAVQPYYKLPLTNIGYGQIKLHSAGVAVGLSWNVGSLTKK